MIGLMTLMSIRRRNARRGVQQRGRDRDADRWRGRQCLAAERLTHLPARPSRGLVGDVEQQRREIDGKLFSGGRRRPACGRRRTRGNRGPAAVDGGPADAGGRAADDDRSHVRFPRDRLPCSPNGAKRNRRPTRDPRAENLPDSARGRSRASTAIASRSSPARCWAGCGAVPAAPSPQARCRRSCRRRPRARDRRR